MQSLLGFSSHSSSASSVDSLRGDEADATKLSPTSSADTVRVAGRGRGGAKKAFKAGPYKTGEGYTTAIGRRLWAEQYPEEAEKAPTTLNANKDTTTPLYFWQINSILGPERIENIVRRFYTYVWKDQDDWFRLPFTETVDYERAVWSQSAFWIDAMGGGRAYHGGHYRLSFHHNQVEEVMHRKGAVRWLEHMRTTLDESDLTEDPRVRPCIDVFLKVHMNKYAEQFEFDGSDLAYQGQGPGCPMHRIYAAVKAQAEAEEGTISAQEETMSRQPDGKKYFL